MPASLSAPDRPLRFLVLATEYLHHNPRARRQIRLLQTMGQVVAIGYSDPCMDGVPFYPLGRKKRSLADKVRSVLQLLAGRYETYLEDRYSWPDIAGFAPDLVCAHDTPTMPRAFHYAGEAPVIIDLHECHHRHFEKILWWKVLFQKNIERLSAKWLPKMRACYTVGENIAQEYRNRFGIDCGVITSAAALQDLAPKPVNPDTIHLVHHGLSNRDRCPENIIELMRHTDRRFVLHLTLIGSGAYHDNLVRDASALKNIIVQDPVPLEQVYAHINQYDMGLIMYPRKSFNIDNCLPNKFFEFIQGRLAIAINNLPEMAALSEKYALGPIAPACSPRIMADLLNSLTTEQIDVWKKNAHTAAQTLCAEVENAKLETLIRGIVHLPR